MKKQQLRAVAEKAQIEINDQINQFIAKLDKASEDPNDFITMSELETEWRQLSHGTNKPIQTCSLTRFLRSTRRN